MNSEAQWHWQEGNKFALEGGKALLLVNGAAAISILTFLGAHADKRGLVWATILFAVGDLSATLCFVFAYITQLHYGNRAVRPEGFSNKAVAWHALCYWTAGVSSALFVGGVVVAALSF